MSYIIGYCVVILIVAAGLGFVIFVHELGHFLVAKLCGVKCEKFYLGFDIGGLKICRFRWGETEYGIGILPLGGYVKMLGQEDNPARLQEEIDRAKGGATDGSATAAQQTLYDPRSFLAQSVPKRMAIISAGVVMNVIFAFLMAVVAFQLGVEKTPCVIGTTLPGYPAWQADLRVGDDVLEIAGKKMTQFRDLQTAISLGDIDPEKGVPLLVRRPGVSEPLTITVKPDGSQGLFIIGVSQGRTTQLLANRKTWLIQKRAPTIPGSVAARAEPSFQNGDKFVQIDDVPIENYAQIDAELARKADQKINVTVERAAENADGKATDKTERVVIPVAPSPMRTLGLAMKMGEITAVQANSPAVAAGIKPGDVIRKIDGKPVDDPMTLPDQLRRRAGETVELTLQRETSKEPVILSARLREPTGFSSSEALLIDGAVGVSSLGVSYRVLNRVDHVIEGGPAAAAELLPDDLIVSATVIPPAKDSQRKRDGEQKKLPIAFSETKRNWPLLCNAIQEGLPGTTVELKVSRQGQEKSVTLTPVDAAGWFNPDRGFQFEFLSVDEVAANFGDACAKGGRETLDMLTMVFRMVHKLSTNQVSMYNLGGPWMIIKTALTYADRGTAAFLIFLTMLSANLAVLNFMPIPLLDGGLMMFLIYEGIRGKPANERVQVVLTYIGLILILALMVWVMGLDFGFIPRH